MSREYKKFYELVEKLFPANLQTSCTIQTEILTVALISLSRLRVKQNSFLIFKRSRLMQKITSSRALFSFWDSTSCSFPDTLKISGPRSTSWRWCRFSSYVQHWESSASSSGIVWSAWPNAAAARATSSKTRKTYQRLVYHVIPD